MRSASSCGAARLRAAMRLRPRPQRALRAHRARRATAARSSGGGAQIVRGEPLGSPASLRAQRMHRRRPRRMYLLSGLCFCGLALNNLLLYADFLVTGPAVDLAIFRNLTAAVSVLLLLVGLIWTYNEGD